VDLENVLVADVHVFIVLNTSLHCADGWLSQQSMRFVKDNC